MTEVGDLWYLASEATQRAEQVYHRFDEEFDPTVEFTTTRSVSRSRFRTVGERIKARGLPYGAHTLAYRPNGDLLLVRHEAFDLWVLPGGEVDTDESFREGARRELHEEAGIEVDYEGLGILGEVRFRCAGNETWGVLPVYEGLAETTDPEVNDPDGEIVDAGWFDDLPENTRDREELLRWRERKLG